MTIATRTPSSAAKHAPSPNSLKKIIARRSFCSLATVSPEGTPHVVGIMYKFVNGHLYFITFEGSRKARNIQGNPRVAIHIPVRKYPFFPPLSIQFQGTATVLSREDPEIADLIAGGKLKEITGLGVLKQPGGCFLRVTPARKIHTYGLGIPILTLLRDVSHGDRTIVID